MCGIAGFFLTDNARIDCAAVLGAMTKSLAHRGPDGAGFHFDDDGRSLGRGGAPVPMTSARATAFLTATAPIVGAGGM